MNSAPNGLATLEFAPGPYPFALTEHDAAKTLSGDQWAWRFLRLSPAYRYDYSLWVARPAWLDRHANKKLVALRAKLPDAEWHTLLASDSRYFVLDGKPLGHSVDWPGIQAQTLQEALSANAKREGNITVRELDAPRLYGLGHWFDPKLVDLPDLPGAEGLRSWFYSLVEPIWESPTHALLPNPDCWASFGEHRVNVGMEPDIGVRLAKMTYVERRPIEAADGTPTTELVEVAHPTAKTGFEYESELAVLLSLEGNVPAQMRAVGQLLHSAAKALSPVQAGAAYATTFEPIIFLATNPRIERFAGLLGSLRDLTATAPAGMKHWCIVLFDLRSGIQGQLDIADELLKKRQLALSKSGELTTPARQRAGTKNEKSFWLKAALCCLEAHLRLTERYPAESFGRRNFTKAVLSPSHPRHAEVRGMSPAGREPSDNELEADTIRDALEIGKSLALGQYVYLVGASAAELQPAERLSNNSRRYVEGKKAPAKVAKRKASRSA